MKWFHKNHCGVFEKGNLQVPPCVCVEILLSNIFLLLLNLSLLTYEKSLSPKLLYVCPLDIRKQW